jgi:signal transduction histidine kinase/CheY-like chemotaxis protein
VTLVVPAALILALLSVFAIELTDTQAKSKRDVESRVHERAVLAASLVSSLFMTVENQTAQDQALYGGPVVEKRRAARAHRAKRGGGQRRASAARNSRRAPPILVLQQALARHLAQNIYIAILSANGSPLAAAGDFTPQARADLAISAALRIVRSGKQLGVGNVLPFKSTGVINIALSFKTRYGTRILLTGIQPALLVPLLSGELKQIPGVKGAHNYILDGNNAVLASTNPSRPAGSKLNSAAQLRALSHLSGDVNGHYYDQVRVANSTWRVVLSAPNGPLFASVSGLRESVPWLIFIAFALVASVALALGWGVIWSADRGMREARRASEMKSNFIANVSHEIRTPLNGVLGMLGLLSESRLTSEQREFVEVAKSSSDALMTVISDILDMGRIEAGRLRIEVEDFNLYEAVEASCEMLSALATAKGLELQAFIREDVPRTVQGDRMRVRQVLVNLLGNAVKFTSEGEVGVEVSVVEKSPQGARVRFQVRDTGIGIEPQAIEHMFEAFSQAESTTTRRFGGTGLGLSISRELTELMGGTIGATSEPGHGSTFWFEIPFVSAEIDFGPRVPLDELTDLRVLVADGNSTNRRVFEAYLESWGMRTAAAADATDALARLHRAAKGGDPFEVVLMDYSLPGANGVELAQELTASPALHDTRVILLTSSGQIPADDPSGSIKRRLIKPLRQSRLLDAITAVMSAPGLSSGLRIDPLVSEAVPAEAAGGGRILVAEDQTVNWRLIDRLLAKRGHEAVNATDGRSALQKLETDHFDLVLMDCQMPLLDGYETTRELRRREVAENRSRVPVIAMTASAMEGDREACLESGMDDYLAKPITAEKLDELLQRWLPEQVTNGAAVRKT